MSSRVFLYAHSRSRGHLHSSAFGRIQLYSQPVHSRGALETLHDTVFPPSVPRVRHLGNLSKGCDYCLAFTDGAGTHLLRLRTASLHAVSPPTGVMKEFFSQGDRERSLGLPLTPGYQRESADVASSQLAFYRFIVEPLYSAVDNLVPAGELLSNLEHMRTEWEAKRQASLEDQLAWLRTSRERIV